MTFSPEDIEIVELAAQTLDEEALALRQTHCKAPEFTDWCGDVDAQSGYESMRAQVGNLYALADRMRAA